MKQTILSVFAPLARAIFGIAILVSPFARVQAQDEQPTAEVRYVGVSGNRYVFEVAFSNDDNSLVSLEIKDGEGFDFYTTRSREKVFRKTFAIDAADMANNTLYFVVNKKGLQQSVAFNAASKQVSKEIWRLEKQ